MKYLDELLETSRKIINKSNEILNLLTNITIDNGSISIKLSQEELENNYNKYIDLIYRYSNVRNNFRTTIARIVVKEIEELKKLVILENKLINSIDNENIDKYLEKIEKYKDIYDTSIIDRVRERLMLREIILNGKNIDGIYLIDNSNIAGLEFDIHDVILAMVYINVFKNLKNKLDNLNTFNQSDQKVIRDLFEYYERAKFKDFNNMPTFEIISLLYNSDMIKVPSINIDKLKKFGSIDDEELEEFFINMATDTIDIIASIDDSYLEEAFKDSSEIFDYLFDITLFEVLISYMDISTLHEVSDYCKEVMKDDNKINIGHINNLVKRKLKD